MRDFGLGKPWLDEPETFLREAQGQHKGSIVFAHGICHGAWCWTNFLDYFPKHGYDCFALSYRGHGQDAQLDKGAISRYKLPEYVEDLSAVVDAVRSFEGGESPFLIGHSMGGAVVQSYIDCNSDKVVGAVLYASAPAKRMRILETFIEHVFSQRLRRAQSVSKGKKLSLEEINDSAFFNGRIQKMADLERYAALLQPESWRVIYCGLMGLKYSKNWQSVSCQVCVTGSSTDEYFPEKFLLRTVRAYDKDDKPVKYKMFDGLCHDMMLDPKWEETADYVLEFINAQTSHSQ